MKTNRIDKHEREVIELVQDYTEGKKDFEKTVIKLLAKIAFLSIEIMLGLQYKIASDIWDRD